VKRIVGTREAKEFAVDRNIDVFRKSSDETVNLGERGASLEKECVTDAVEGEKPLSVQQTQKSFSTTCGGRPRRAAASVK